MKSKLQEEQHIAAQKDARISSLEKEVEIYQVNHKIIADQLMEAERRRNELEKLVRSHYI